MIQNLTIFEMRFKFPAVHLLDVEVLVFITEPYMLKQME